jgi:cytochrome c oxidase subunit II
VKIPSQVLTLLFGIGLTLISLWYGYNHHLLPIAASEEAVLIDDLFNFMMVISVGIFILVQGALLWVAFRYQRNPDDNTDAKYVHGNIPLEIVWTAIPAVIMLALSLYSFDVYEQIGGLNPMDHSAHMANTGESKSSQAMMTSMGSTSGDHPLMSMDSESPANPSIPLARTSDPFVVNVSGLQFAWLFNYEGTELSTGELHLPVNREIILNISAMDVLHAFWVPEFRIKQDAVPGRTIPIRITPNKVGTYPLICAELCGAYHGVMRSQVIVESEAEVNAWMAEQAVAMKEVDHAVEQSTAIAALHPELLSDADYLKPYAKTLGVTVEHIRSIQAAQQQS